MKLSRKLDDLIYRHTAKTLALGYLRYEALRRLNATQFSRLCQRNIRGEAFDDLVDELVKSKECELVENVKTHTERIICPGCHKEQTATVEHTWPFWGYVHHCECGYIIIESEWEKVKQ